MPTGLWKNYYDSGALKSEGKKRAGKSEGKWIFYSQKGQIEVLANQALYIQLIQNLNSQELLLKTQTPLIQIIDETLLPLGVKLPERNVILAYYIFFGLLFSILFLIIQKLMSEFLNENILNDK